MIDDCSKDNSVNLIKKLMIKDPRIKLLQNEENRGMLYTKTKGVLNSKGKYVMLLDEDDIYVQKDAFLTLYLEAEENNLDIIGYAQTWSNIHLEKNKNKLGEYIETPIIIQPNVKKRMYDYGPNGEVKQTGGFIRNYFFKTEIFIKSIKQINDNFLNIKMNYHDDFLLFFLISRNAYSYKHIKRIFYVVFDWTSKYNAQIKFRSNEKEKNKDNLSCFAYLSYIEFILIKTDNTVIDKKIASFELEKWFLNHGCRKNKFIRNQGINLCKLFLENEYIENSIKNKITTFLKEINST